MKFKFLVGAVVSIIISITSLKVSAGVIDASSILLDDAGASQLENWYGQGDLDWDSIWYGTTGATATSWHAAVDGVSDTFSIYNVTFNDNVYLVGGYNSGAWGSSGSYQHGLVENFIFNLTSNIRHTTDDGNWDPQGQYATYNGETFFATFGGGFDLYGGQGVIGGLGQSTGFGTYNGVVGSGEKGNIFDEVTVNVSFRINSLETFTVSLADEVPEPSHLLWLL